MTFWLAQLMVWLAGLYIVLGFLFALWFVTVGLARADESATGASLSLRILWLPGVIAFWPLLARRAWRMK